MSMNGAIYNEIEPYPAARLRNLIAAGHIASGVVDERSIADLEPADVAGPGQRHFFAGIGVWSHALRLAGWPDDLDVWTGSCPCQPFSGAGLRAGFSDERHLWPTWFALIRECRPAVVLGEQVASDDGLAWLDAVLADMEGAGYTVAAVDLCAAGVGAPHIRQRLFFVAHRSRRGGGEVANQLGDRSADDGEARRLGYADGERAGRNGGATSREEAASSGRRIVDRDLGDELDASGATRGFWSPADWIPCTDGKLRPVEPGTFPLAHGATARVGRLRAYGNAIVPQAAAAFIGAVMDVLGVTPPTLAAPDGGLMLDLVTMTAAEAIGRLLRLALAATLAVPVMLLGIAADLLGVSRG